MVSSGQLIRWTSGPPKDLRGLRCGVQHPLLLTAAALQVGLLLGGHRARLRVVSGVGSSRLRSRIAWLQLFPSTMTSSRLQQIFCYHCNG
jgi:hypothetical protein